MATLTLLWLEGAEPGTAAGNHLAGTIQRLATLGITHVRVLASRAGSRKRTTVARLRRLGGLMVRGSVVPKQSRQLLARWHPLLTFPMLMWKLRGRSVYLCVQGVLDDCVAENPMVRRVPMLDRLARWSLAHADGVVVPDPGIGVGPPSSPASTPRRSPRCVTAWISRGSTAIRPRAAMAPTSMTRTTRSSSAIWPRGRASTRCWVPCAAPPGRTDCR